MHPLASARIKKRWTQTKLAEKAGVSKVTISRLELGYGKKTQLLTKVRIAEALAVSMEKIFPEELPNLSNS